jgi:hypothetical protein
MAVKYLQHFLRMRMIPSPSVLSAAYEKQYSYPATCKSDFFTKVGSLSAKSSQSAREVDLKTSQPDPLSAFQLQSVARFIHVFGAFSLPSSIGEIYRILLSTLEPLSLGDSTKARTRLGWKPKVSFDALVEMVVDADMVLDEQGKLLQS